MNKHIAKIVIINSLLFGCLIGMNHELRNPEWRCPKHTSSKEELIHLGLLEATMGGTLAFVALKDTLLFKYLSGSSADATPEATVAGGTAAQRLAIVESGQSKHLEECLSFSALLFCDVGDKLWKIRHYQDYVRQKHDNHKCLTNHQ